MWFGIGWRFKPVKLFEVIGVTALFTYLYGWVKGRESAEKEGK